MNHIQSTPVQKKCIAVIPSIEGWHLLVRLLPTIDLPRDQILVIDQGSQDGTEQKCQIGGYGCVQMHERATFTQAVNRGIKEALERGADYVLVVNNDVEFLTHVATQLLKRAESENNLGLISPRQIAITDKGKSLDIKRVSWDLTKLSFSHEFDKGEDKDELLEADFCEFTCVLIKSDVFHRVGLLDERYQFYHEDADFAFRCQQVGFRSVYDQTALIRHYIGSTFDKQKTYSRKKLIKRNKSYFAIDHLKHHIRFPIASSKEACSWSNTNEFLGFYLNKYGLLSSNSDAPTVSTIAHPEMVQSDYLLTVWETSELPRTWVEESKKFEHIFVPSLWNKEIFERSGFTNVSVLPFGVEPDIYNPWGPKLAFAWAKSILCVFQDQYRKALDVTLKMWNQIRTKHPESFLVLYGKGIELSKLGMDNCLAIKMGNFLAKIDASRQMVLLQPSFGEYVNHSDMAILYRSCDFYLLNSRSEGFGYPILEAMASGTVCVIPNYGAAQEFIREGNCISFEGIPTEANYKDKGFDDVGDWWEPNFKDLCLKMEQALNLDAQALAEMSKRARQNVLSHYTWRHSMLALRKSLEQLQSSSVHKANLERKSLIRKCRKRLASLMNSLGHTFLNAARVLELHGIKEFTSKIKSKLVG